MSAGFTAQVVELLNADGWRPRWPACTNAITDVPKSVRADALRWARETGL